jgi:hypothetical protein
MLKDLGMKIHLFDEREVEAEPDIAPGAGAGALGIGAEANSLMVRERGSVMALPIIDG